MVAFNKFFTSVFLAIVYASSTLAAPWPASLKHTTNRLRLVGRDLQLNTFHPESTFETFGEGIDHPLRKRALDDEGASIEERAIAFVKSHLKLADGGVAFRSGFSGEVSDHAFVRQTINGIPIANAVANVAFNKDDKVQDLFVAFYVSNAPSTTPTVPLSTAISAAESAVGGTFNDHPPTLEFLALEDGSLRLTHVMQIQNQPDEETGEGENVWVEAFVDAHSGEVLSVVDFVTKASYLVLPIQKEILTQGFETLTNPQDTVGGPDGWHSDGTTTTTGNNAISFKGAQTAVTSQSAANLVFNYPQSATTAPTTQANVDAARVNAFYVVNTIHDLSYRYGFTEAAFNFQNNNFNKGGRGNDRVTISVQNSAGIDNADFSTPPECVPVPLLLFSSMFLWDFTNPMRDGALENDIVTHENTHGITNRMTGGGTGRCLQTLEAGGMGWSDAMADWNEKTSAAVPDYVMGQYVINSAAGIRSHPYSTSATTNPLRYSSLRTLNEVHDIGEVWANILHNVYAALVSAHGWSATARTTPTGTQGNIVFMHIFIDALALQPCNPTFLTARDAWIQADANRFGGANACTLWRAFASRGLGTNAANHNDGTAVPAGC
ncbi:extracellular metallo proteinase mep [Favolaschia claudopus]|uniref:Extracellular metalloproteinase n=1 Tax=Favolaschia claudopus TaxID=2862362 RepID=A0AAV9ZFV4_9AGAR